MKPNNIRRHLVQLVSTFITNPHVTNYAGGTIYKGQSKQLCTPGLNCYSCPAAGTACPIGALQAVENSNRYHISYYVMGFLLITGAFLGRFVCGFLCPFGFFQDLLHKLPVRKRSIPRRLDKILRYTKYLILAVFVIALPTALINEFGISEPYFCKLICPAGTIEAGLPLVIKNESLRAVIGILFDWKVILLAITVILSTMIYRPFCKYVCPLGAVYSLFNRFSVLQLEVDDNSCINCMKCETNCDMQVNVPDNINSTECIRCGKCRSICPTGAINWTVSGKIILHTGDAPRNQPPHA